MKNKLKFNHFDLSRELSILVYLQSLPFIKWGWKGDKFREEELREIKPEQFQKQETEEEYTNTNMNLPNIQS